MERPPKTETGTGPLLSTGALFLSVNGKEVRGRLSANVEAVGCWHRLTTPTGKAWVNLESTCDNHAAGMQHTEVHSTKKSDCDNCDLRSCKFVALTYYNAQHLVQLSFVNQSDLLTVNRLLNETAQNEHSQIPLQW